MVTLHFRYYFSNFQAETEVEASLIELSAKFLLSKFNIMNDLTLISDVYYLKF